MLTVVMVFMGLVMVGVIGAGLVLLHHLLKKKEEQAKMDALKSTVIPELERMTLDMMNKMFDIIPEKTVEMTKSFMKVQKELEDEMY